MSLPNDKRGREYQFFKDTEAFGSVLAASTTGSVALLLATPRVGDILLFNSGSTDVYYNIGVSGGAVVASTSGTLLEAGAKMSYSDVGFDVVSAITSAGVSKVFVQKIYSARD